jgi:hypothetical protein
MEEAMDVPEDFDPSNIIEFIPDLEALAINTAEGIQNFHISEFDLEMLVGFVVDGYIGVGILVYLGFDELLPSEKTSCKKRRSPRINRG